MGENHDVNVITTYDKGMPNHSNIDGFNIYRVPRSQVRFLGFLLYWFKMFLIIKKLKPDIIHVQGFYMTIPAVLAKKLLNIPYVIYGRGSDVYTSWPYKRIISRLGVNNTEILIALTESMKKEMQKSYNKQIEVIPNGIDTEKFDLDKYESREKLGLDHEQKIILFIGRLEYVKGLKYLINAMNILKNNKKNLKLIVIGDGSESDNLKSQVKKLKLEDIITFKGKLPNENIPIYLASSNLFILPSLSEGFPNVLLETMATGLPIITTKIGGLPEIVENTINGFLVAPRSPEELVDKIDLILNNENLAKKISVANKEKSKSYNWNNIVELLEKIYNSPTIKR